MDPSVAAGEARLECAMRVVLLGGGEHASVVADAASRSGLEVLGYADHERVQGAGASGLAWLGDDATAADLAAGRGASAILALAGEGSLALRRRLVDFWSARVPFATVVHPSASVARTARL